MDITIYNNCKSIDTKNLSQIHKFKCIRMGTPILIHPFGFKVSFLAENYALIEVIFTYGYLCYSICRLM